MKSKFRLLDRVVLDTGRRGIVSQFEIINNRTFVGVRVKGFWGSNLVWASENALEHEEMTDEEKEELEVRKDVEEEDGN